MLRYHIASVRRFYKIVALAAMTACGGLTTSNNDAGNDGRVADGFASSMAESSLGDRGDEDSFPDVGPLEGGSCQSSDSGIQSQTEPPSCAPGGPGMTDCGTNTESCCASLEVTGGVYFRSYDNSGSGPTHESDPATVSGLRIDKYVVTVGRFRQFVKVWRADACYATPRAGSGKHTHLNGGKGLANSESPGSYELGWSASADLFIAPTDANLGCWEGDDFASWTSSPGSDETRPINCVNWYEAYAFCIWDGGFLPSEAEWEYAAAGGDKQREYPWGSTEPGSDSTYAIYGCYYDTAKTACGCSAATARNIAPVGAAPRGVGYWGHLDLAGEILEWTLDTMAPYAQCSDCAYLTTKYAPRVERGGYFGGSTSDMLPTRRGDTTPTDRYGSIGFRCARVP
jgi:formylglycine-generating enzyme